MWRVGDRCVRDLLKNGLKALLLDELQAKEVTKM